MIPFYYFAKLAQYLTKEPTAVKNMLKENNLPHFEPREVWQWPTFALYECFWQREDPVMQLPPGASSELVLSFRVGVSLERSREISAALGLKRGREKQKEQQTEISFHAAGKVTRKLCLSEEREVTHKQLLKNTASDQYRRLAVWHLMHRITIIAAPDAELAVKAVCQETEFILSDASNVTFADVPLPPIPPTSAPSSQP